MDFLRKLFDTSKKDVENVLPVIEQINGLESKLKAFDDDQLKEFCAKLRVSAKNGEPIDKLIPETFAAVREVSQRTLGMRQFDVQLIGGVVLHQGRIAEMRTGEGKTLVAVAPLILNALSGHGAHLVTVNDYLARRDAVWMGPIYHFFGMSVGIIQGQGQDSDELGGSYKFEPGAYHEDPRYMNLVPCSRREAYACDITYGTNHEFGFDYLKDNMAHDESELVMSELNFAMIDEVDSILIDEARTPHIISGPSHEDVSVYKETDLIVRQLVLGEHYTADKKNQSAQLTEEGMDKIEELMGLDNIASHPKVFHHVNASIKAYGLFDKDIDYVVRKGEVVIVDENTGHMMFGRRYGDGLHQALEAKEKVTVQRESQTVATITFQNLFRLYHKLAGMTGTAKTEEDEFRKIYGLDVVAVPTHRNMVRKDQADAIFKTAEAKYRSIAWEILRLYSKQQPVLVGTRSIEMSEKVSSRITSENLQRMLIAMRLREKAEGKDLKGDQKRDATEMYLKNIEDLNRQQVNVLLGQIGLESDLTKGDWQTWFFENSELPETAASYFQEAITHGIPHNILNAKYHEREAVIIAEAGRKGQVTIATNMAGRGVDILLGGRVEDATVRSVRDATISHDDKDVIDEYAETYATYRRGGKERAAPPLPLDDQERKGLAEEVRGLGGLYILGTERHESRRIDNQLRGRAGRQGDPGESKFYVSLEDTLWKIFNANMMDNPVLKMWPPMEEVSQKFLSKQIEKTQERIENHFFEGRKHVLEYDDVLNAQREDIYAMRREILLGKDCRAEIQSYIPEIMDATVENAWVIDETDGRVYDYNLLFEDLNEIFPLVDFATIADFEKHAPDINLVETVSQYALQAYNAKIEQFGDKAMRGLERQVMLYAVNERWMEHLQTIDYIREGIQLRGYGQIDPLIAYKRETFETFKETKRNIHNDAVKFIFTAQVNPQAFAQEQNNSIESLGLHLEDRGDNLLDSLSGTQTGPLTFGNTATAVAVTDINKIDWKKVGRNDSCPCGSGKKFKACHYPALRAEGII